MKVLMMHRGDGGLGGGQVQMLRLRSALARHGVDARVFCRETTRADSVRMPARPRLERWLEKITSRAGLNDLHLVSSFDVPKLADFQHADLIDIHSLHSGTFSYLALPALTADKPAVFTFHDMWPITGHCQIRRDSTALEWKWKQRAYSKSEFTIVTPSRWLHDLVKQSMLRDFPVQHIPHGIDMEVFRPLDKEHSRDLLGIPRGKHVIICALESMRRPLKGADLLVQALHALPESLQRESVLLLFGHTSAAVLRQIRMPVIELGYLHNEHLKALAFSAADLFINPTRAESFGLVALESMACGTPSVCFRVGGLPELVRPGVTGTLVEPFNPAALAGGVADLLGDRAALDAMSRACREVAVAEFALDLQARRYAEIYASVAGRHPPAVT